MRAPTRRQLWPIAIGAGITIAVLIGGGALFMASGIYNVAASRGHFKLTEVILEFALRRSVSTHSFLIRSPPLDDPDMVRLGAGHFFGGCALCHGAPDNQSSPIVQQMLPPPPPLSKAASEWTAEQLFWIVKHGIKYTGMPAWPTQERDDEVWAMVAFLRKLPELTPEEYRQLANASAAPKDRTALDLARFGSGEATIAACARCHGDESAPPASRLIPKLAGQPARYLKDALKSYAAGLRPSGIMKPVASELSEEVLGRIAEYYAGLPDRKLKVSPAPSAGQIDRGRRIALEGIPENGVPACAACHSGRSAVTFPRLAGQHAPYVVQQLQLWQKGLRADTAHGAIMAPIARRLTEQQMRDVAAYLESLETGEDLRAKPRAGPAGRENG